MRIRFFKFLLIFLMLIMLAFSSVVTGTIVDFDIGVSSNALLVVCSFVLISIILSKIFLYVFHENKFDYIIAYLIIAWATFQLLIIINDLVEYCEVFGNVK